MFDSENDSEVGARFVAARLAQGDDLDKALRLLCERFDGFYTLLVTSGDGFAVVRDAIACKPAIIAETRRLGRHGVGVPRPGAAAGHRVGPDLRAGAGEGLRMAALNTEHTLTSTEARVVDLAGSSVRALNAELHAPGAGAYEVLHPDGAHAIAAGLRHPLTVDVRGHAGYYCAGMNDGGVVTVHGSAGVGVAENMMSGTVRVRGDASQSAGATGARRAAGDRGQRLDALRHLDEGHRHRRRRRHRPDERVHGTGRAARRVRRRGRRARRLDLRGPSLRPRRASPRSGPTASRSRCATSTAPSWRSCSPPPGSTTTRPEFRRYGSARRLYHFAAGNSASY